MSQRRLHTNDSPQCLIKIADGESLNSKECKLLGVKRIYKFINVAIGDAKLVTKNRNFVNKISSVVDNFSIETIGETNIGNKYQGKNRRIKKSFTSEILRPKLTICFIDTGINPHIDFVIPYNRIIRFVDMVEGKKQPYDDNGHGTFIAGICAGNGIMSGKRICGIAAKFNLVVIKAIDKKGKSTAIKILDAMKWIEENHDKYNIGIVSMSFGSERARGEFDPLELGVEALSKVGITTVCASGNSGKGHLKSPATSQIAISVGAVDNSLNVPEFTSRGVINGIAKPDYYAIGVDVIGLSRSYYTKMSGTSVAAPYIAGICAMIKSLYPDITEDGLRIALDKLSVAVDGIKII